MVNFTDVDEEQNIRNVDVLVVGAGPSGCAAAIMSGRCGKRTMIIDTCSVPGGISTSGLMSHFTGTVESKLYEEVLDRMASPRFLRDSCAARISIEPTALTLTWIEMLEEANVDILMYTMACNVIVDGNAVKGVVIQNKTGRSLILAKVVIDATGDGDIAAKAGAEYFMGRETDEAMQPATLMFKVCDVDMERAVFPGSFETKVYTEKGELQELAMKILPPPAGHVLLYKSPIDGVVTVNMTNAIGIDGTTAEGMTKAEIECRKQIPLIVKFLREYVPGFERCKVVSTASLIGIRETRHFIGVQQITEKDILNCKVFDNWVVRGAEFNFDVHNMTGASLDKTGAQESFPENTKYTIPYGCFVPANIDNLLLSGRSISGTHMAHSNYRAMPICVAMGEAVGVAAALAVEENVPVRDVDAKEIQKYL